MKQQLLLASACLAILLTSCSASKKIEALRPEPSGNQPVVYESATSFINLPVTITLADAEYQVNKFLTDIIYEDNDIKDDNVAMKVFKTAPIKFNEQKGKLISVVPIKVNAKVKYGTTAMGIELYDTRDVSLSAVITFSSKVGLSNWKLTTKTTIESLAWKETPTVSIAGQKIAITYLINPAVKLFKTEIENQLDKALGQVTDFKPQVVQALETLSEPFKTNEEYDTWFRLTPVELYVTDAVLSKKQITMDMGLKCSMLTVVGQKPKKEFNKDKIVLKAVSKMPDKVNLMVAAVSTYESASRVITKNFSGQEFGEGNKKVKVQKVDLWGRDGKMIIALDLVGTINGTIYLSGYPSYNPATKEIYFDQLDYVLNTKGLLTKTANWLAQGYILRKIQETCRYSIAENMEEGKKNLEPYFNNYSPVEGVFINGSINDFEFDKVQLTNNAIIAFIKGSGKVNLKINGLK